MRKPAPVPRWQMERIPDTPLGRLAKKVLLAHIHEYSMSAKHKCCTQNPAPGMGQRSWNSRETHTGGNRRLEEK